MRLRLIVKRHNLPDAAIIWSVEAANDLTISQLLEQVNEIIPLESSGEWGLEDYAVEVTGSSTNFECLHFQLVKSILHEDDEIVVRPLLTQDLKHRRLSGRHQITSDGRHLFDGFSFGRPRPRGAPDRPTVTIPPRKRRRILYSAEDEEGKIDEILALGGLSEVVEHANGGRELVIRREFEDDDEDDAEEDDEDFEPGEGDDPEDMSGDDSESESQQKSTNEEEEVSEDDEDMDSETHDGAMSKLQTAFPKAPPSIVERILLSCGGDMKEAWVSLSRGFKPVDGAGIGDISNLSPRKTRSMRNKSTKRKRSTPEEDEIENDIGFDSGGSSVPDQENSLLDYYDQHGLPGGSIISGKALSKMAEIANPNLIGTASGQVASKKARSLSMTSNKSVRFAGDDSATKIVNTLDFGDDQDEDEDDDLSDDISSSSGSSDASSESVNDEGTSTDESDSTSSSGSDSDSSSSDSDSEPDETSSKANGEVSGPPEEDDKRQDTSSNDLLADQKTVPPGEGTKSTKARNQRRRIANQLQRFRSTGILPAGTTIEEFKQLDKTALETPEAAVHALTELKLLSKSLTPAEKTEKTKADMVAFEAKRTALLASIASGGVEVTKTGRSYILDRTISDPQATDSEMADVIQPLTATEKVSESHTDTGADRTETVIVHSARVINETTQMPAEQPSATVSEQMDEDSTPRRRVRLDLSAGRRLLFGALGIRTPKTKKDEEKIRNDLMKHVRPLKAVSTTEPLKDINEEENSEDPDAWRQHIVLRAVECCHEGIELSEPPFPFIQRWDPQQQGGYFDKGNRGGKGKKSQRNQPQYYDEEQENTKKRKRNNSQQEEYYDSYEQSFFSDSAANAEVFEDENGNYGNSIDMQKSYGDGIEGEVSDQIMRDVHEAATSQPDDLPALPTDMSSLPDLSLENVMVGMAIAFKQLVMSESTNWQPTIADYRTAVVIVTSENGSLELMLAKRDRIQAERYYDEETGERIYGKFDMPDDDEDQDEDDGYVAVTFAELIEPKIVQFPPGSLTNAAAGESCSEMVDSQRADSKTLSNEEPIEDVQKRTTDASASDGEVGALHNSEVDSPSIRGGHLSSANQVMSTSTTTTDMGIKTSIFIKETGFTSERMPEASAAEPAASELTSITSNGLDQKPSLSSVASQVTDHGRQPDFSTAGDDTLERFGDIDSFLQADATSPISEAQVPLTPEQDDLLDPSLSRTSWHDSVVNDSSDANLPSLDEVFSTARSSMGLKQEKIVPQALSSIVEHDKSYNEAMVALDAQFDDEGDPDLPTPKTSQKSGSSFKIPSGSQQVDLTISSDIEPSSDAGKANDGDYEDKYVTTRKRRGPRRKTAASSKASSQSLSQDSGKRASRRKSKTQFQATGS